MTKLQKIIKKHGSYQAAVEHYAGMGYSRTRTAGHLKISRKYLYRLNVRFDLDHLFRNRKVVVPDNRITDADLLKWVRDCSTGREFNERSPFNVGTIYKRFGGWLAAKDIVRQERMKQRQIELYGRELTDLVAA